MRLTGKRPSLTLEQLYFVQIAAALRPHLTNKALARACGGVSPSTIRDAINGKHTKHHEQQRRKARAR